jgi:hypothetical protein
MHKVGGPRALLKVVLMEEGQACMSYSQVEQANVNVSFDAPNRGVKLEVVPSTDKPRFHNIDALLGRESLLAEVEVVVCTLPSDLGFGE